MALGGRQFGRLTRRLLGGGAGFAGLWTLYKYNERARAFLLLGCERGACLRAAVCWGARRFRPGVGRARARPPEPARWGRARWAGVRLRRATTDGLKAWVGGRYRITAAGEEPLSPPQSRGAAEGARARVEGRGRKEHVGGLWVGREGRRSGRLCHCAIGGYEPNAEVSVVVPPRSTTRTICTRRVVWDAGRDAADLDTECEDTLRDARGTKCSQLWKRRR